ncbi:MAG: YtxH domain-containing protein [Dehalococcoidia bacterium]|jgi:gas vesicle protein
MNKDSSSGFFAGLIIGAIIGAAVGLLYAPQPGSETRRMVKEKASEVKGKAAEAVRRMKDSVSGRMASEEE